MGSIPGSVPGALRPTKEKFYDAPYCSVAAEAGLGGFHGCDIDGDGEYAYINCYIPEDFHALVDIAVVFLGGATLTPMTLRIVTNYCANGEAYTTHNELVNMSINAVNNQLTELEIIEAIDIAAESSGPIAAGDYLGVQVSRQAGQNTHALILGVRIHYV